MVFISRIRHLAFQLGLLACLPVLAWPQGTYTTSFPVTENPISESGRWINGKVVGLDWSNVQTTAGLAFGTELSSSPNDDDSTALLTGAWGPNQTATAVVHMVGTPAAETEIRLRSNLSAHSCTGYEVNFSVGYTQIVAWLGPLNSFRILATNSSITLHNGDTVKATIVGNTITSYINGTQVNHVTDTTYATGAPGIGMFNAGGGDPTQSDLGFSSFTVTDGTTQTGPSFTVSSSPSSQSVTAGAKGTYTVSVVPSGGFTGTVSLSASGQPSGATASFSPSSITTSGASTLTISTASSTAAGSYPITIMGTSGSLKQTAAATLTVSASSGGSGTVSAACDLNKDGTTNVIDVQVAVNDYLSCTAGPNVASQSFVTQVVNGALGASCSATTGAHTVSLNWTASTTAGVGYYVYRATTSGGYTTPLNSSPISGTSFSDCTVAPGQTYYYVVRSVDSSGNQSANSGEVVASIPS